LNPLKKLLSGGGAAGVGAAGGAGGCGPGGATGGPGSVGTSRAPQQRRRQDGCQERPLGHTREKGGRTGMVESEVEDNQQAGPVRE